MTGIIDEILIIGVSKMKWKMKKVEGNGKWQMKMKMMIEMWRDDEMWNEGVNDDNSMKYKMT